MMSSINPSFTLTIKTDLTTPTTPELGPAWWGIREFSLVEEKCHLSCKTCNGEFDNNCLDCYGRMALRNGEC
jgi:hypothetical protein